MFSYYSKKLIACPATYVGAVILFLSMLSVFEDQGKPDPELLYFFQCTMPIGITHWFLPVATVLPVCFVRREMRQGAAWQFPLLHSSPLRYSVGGLLAAFVSGAWIVVVAVVLFILFVYFAIAFPGSLSLRVDLFSDPDFYPFLTRLPQLAVFGILTVVLAGCGGMYAAVSYTVSGFSRNQYICAASPLLLFFAASYSTQGLTYYLKYVAGTVPMRKRFWLQYLDPAQVPVGFGSTLEEGPDGGLVYWGIYLSAVLLICGGLFYFRLRRRLRNG